MTQIARADIIQKSIYGMLARPRKVNQALDYVGAALNKCGIPYATGLTRNKAILLCSDDSNERNIAEERLLSYGRNRADWAVFEYYNGTRSVGLKIRDFLLDVNPSDPPCFVAGAGIGGEILARQDIAECILRYKNCLNGLFNNDNLLIEILIKIAIGIASKEEAKLTDLEMRMLHKRYGFYEHQSQAHEHAKEQANQIIDLVTFCIENNISINNILLLVDISGYPYSCPTYGGDNRLQLFITDIKNLYKTGKTFYDVRKILEKCPADSVEKLDLRILEKIFKLKIEDGRANQILQSVLAISDSTGLWIQWVCSHLTSILAHHRSGNIIYQGYVDMSKKEYQNLESILLSYVVLFNSSFFLNDLSGKHAVNKFNEMLDSLADFDFTRKRIFELLIDNQDLYKKIGRKNFLNHFTLYMNILIKYKRSGLQILEGIFEATKLGIIPDRLTDKIRNSICSYIDKTGSFSPIVYKVYKEKGDAVLEDLKALSQKILKDELGRDEIEAFKKKYENYDGMEFLYSAVLMSIPLSGASFLKREEGKKWLEKLIEVGDLRAHVPSGLSGAAKNITLYKGGYVLKNGENVDQFAILPIVQSFKAKKKPELPELVSALETYLKSNRSELERDELRNVLYKYASRKDKLSEKLERLTGDDYYSLNLLEEIFKDKDNLVSILLQAMDRVDSELLRTEKRELIGHENLIKSIRKMWKNSGTAAEKNQRMLAMLSRYKAEEVKNKILANLNPETEADIILSINEALNEGNKLFASKQKISVELLEVPLQAIQNEKKKFILDPQKEQVALELRIVKGIPFGLWGLNAGVCVASDLPLWKDNKFKLIALIDADSKKVAGFIHIYEVDGCWTLPGINPSTEFLSTIDAGTLFNNVMEKVVEMAKDAGIKGVYIPTLKTEKGYELIASNKASVVKAIEDHHYDKKTIPEVKWNKYPQPYIFNEVLVIWE